MICYPDGVPEVPASMMSSLTSSRDDETNASRAARRRDITRILRVSFLPRSLQCDRKHKAVTSLRITCLQTVDRWRMRVALLELQLMHRLCAPADLTSLLDSIADCTIEAFTSSSASLTSSATRVKRQSGTSSSAAEKKPPPITDTDSVSNHPFVDLPCTCDLEMIT